MRSGLPGQVGNTSQQHTVQRPRRGQWCPGTRGFPAAGLQVPVATGSQDLASLPPTRPVSQPLSCLSMELRLHQASRLVVASVVSKELTSQLVQPFWDTHSLVCPTHRLYFSSGFWLFAMEIVHHVQRAVQ